jgi:predicted nucleic acid-binding protein
MRAEHPQVREPWSASLRSRQFRLSPAVRSEILFGAPDGEAFDESAAVLDLLPPAPWSTSIIRAAEAGMRALAHRSPGSHRIPLTDYYVAAAAQDLGCAVLHYDHHYDRLADVMGFESVWLAPPGSLP